jgi:hypothetical protein
LSHPNTRLTTTPGYAATTKKKKKKSKKAKLPLTGGGGSPSNDPQVLPPQPEVHTTVNPTPEHHSSMKANSKKRPFAPSETPAGDSEDLASVSVSAAVSALPKNKKRKRGKKSPTTAGAETDGITSLS